MAISIFGAAGLEEQLNNDDSELDPEFDEEMDPVGNFLERCRTDRLAKEAGIEHFSLNAPVSAGPLHKTAADNPTFQKGTKGSKVARTETRQINGKFWLIGFDAAGEAVVMDEVSEPAAQKSAAASDDELEPGRLAKRARPRADSPDSALTTAIYGDTEFGLHADADSCLEEEIEDPVGAFIERCAANELAKSAGVEDVGWNAQLFSAPRPLSKEFEKRSDARLEKVHEKIRKIFAAHPEEMQAAIEVANGIREQVRAEILA